MPELITAIAGLLSVIAWPAALIASVVIIRREIRKGRERR